MLIYRVIDDENTIVYQGGSRSAAREIAATTPYSDVECRDVDACGHYGHSTWKFRVSGEEFIYGLDPLPL